MTIANGEGVDPRRPAAQPIRDLAAVIPNFFNSFEIPVALFKIASLLMLVFGVAFIGLSIRNAWPFFAYDIGFYYVIAAYLTYFLGVQIGKRQS
jgi:hypothetical protein